MYLNGHIALANRVLEGFFVCLVHRTYMHTDHRKMNTHQQTLDHSFETHQNVFIRKDGHLPFLRMTQKRDVQHKSRYVPKMYVKSQI